MGGAHTRVEETTLADRLNQGGWLKATALKHHTQTSHLFPSFIFRSFTMSPTIASAWLASVALLSGSAMAAVTLQPTLTAPTELQIGQHDQFILSVKNAGNTSGSGVVVRMRFHNNLTLAYAGPTIATYPEPPSPCTVVTEAFGNSNNVRQVKCNFGTLSAGATKAVRLVVKAPASGYTLVNHNLRATSGSVLGTSTGVSTRYRHYNHSVVPDTHWNTQACGGSQPIAYDVCPPHSTVNSQVTLMSGGVWEEGTWVQTSPNTIDFNYGTDTVHLTAISSRCFRGPNAMTTTQGNPWYTVFQLCLAP